MATQDTQGNFLRFRNSREGAKDILVGVVKVEDVWTIQYLDEYGGLPEDKKIEWLVKFHENPKTIVTVAIEGADLWIDVVDDEVLFRRTPPGDGVGVDEAPVRDIDADGRLPGADDYHVICQCSDQWKECQPGQDPGSCCT